MYQTLAAGTPLYRVTDPRFGWELVLRGEGSYFNSGGRFNRPQQRTVYTSDDPLVALTEAAYSQARECQQTLGTERAERQRFPLTSDHRLWCFTLTSPVRLVDLEHPKALHVFQHTPHWLFNPSRHYENTQRLADAVRVHRTPAIPDFPGGLRAPSARTPLVAGYQPGQVALFVMPMPYEGVLRAEWPLTLEFLDGNGGSATFDSPHIDWRSPRFRLDGGSPVPAFAGRPGSKAYRPRRWYRLAIRWA